MYVRLRFEEVRQANVLRNGGEILQETRRFDDATGQTILMRVKEGSSDLTVTSQNQTYQTSNLK